MVTFITILQVNLVMSVLLYVMFLAYLCGIQATSMDRHKPTPDPVNSLIIKLLQADIVRSRQRQEEVPDDGVAGARDPSQGTVSQGVDYLQRTPSVNLEIDAGLLEQHRRYNSPRVLLSERPPLQPPPMYLADDYVGGTDAVNRTRRKRYAEHKSYRGEYSVCDSESQWVTNKSSAVDIRGRLVTLLEDIRTSGSNVKQYFYETKCRSAKPFKGGCRGIDDKHWNSQCKTQQTYVRALAVERVSIVNWRWIRIDTACVCALSRKKRRT